MAKDKKKSKSTRMWSATDPSCLIVSTSSLFLPLFLSTFLLLHSQLLSSSLVNINFLNLIIKSPLGATPPTPSDTVGSTQRLVEPRFKVGPARENLSPMRCPYVIRSESIWGFRPKDSITIFVLEKLCISVDFSFCLTTCRVDLSDLRKFT